MNRLQLIKTTVRRYSKLPEAKDLPPVARKRTRVTRRKVEVVPPAESTASQHEIPTVLRMTQQERFIFRAKRFFNDTKRVKSLAMSSAGLVVVWNSGYIYDSVKTAIFGPEEEEDEVVEGASAVTGGSAETNQDDNITESSSVQSTSSSSIASETQTPTQTLAAPSDDSTNTHVEQQPSSPTPSSSLAIEPLSTPIDTVLPSLPEPLEGMLEGNIKLGSVEVSKKSVAATAAATGTLALIAALLTKSN